MSLKASSTEAVCRSSFLFCSPSSCTITSSLRGILTIQCTVDCKPSANCGHVQSTRVEFPNDRRLVRRHSCIRYIIVIAIHKPLIVSFGHCTHSAIESASVGEEALLLFRKRVGQQTHLSRLARKRRCHEVVCIYLSCIRGGGCAEVRCTRRRCDKFALSHPGFMKRSANAGAPMPTFDTAPSHLL